MKKYLIATLLIQVCLGQMNFVNSFLNTKDLVLSNGQKTEKIKVGKNITIGYQDSVERKVVGKIKEVTDLGRGEFKIIVGKSGYEQKLAD